MKPSITLSSRFVRGLLPARTPDSQKYDYGHVLIVGGSAGMTGAAILCAHGALRAGAGLVTIAVSEEQLPTVLPRLRPEVMTLALPASNGTVSAAAVSIVKQYVDHRRVTALVVGPGMGTDTGVTQFLARVFASVALPLVIDADALNALARSASVRTAMRNTRGPVIFTPHVGELGRLIDRDPADVSRERIDAAVQCAALYKCVCVLKGHRTVITDGERVFINPTGNPGMATAGAGDVLAGMIGALVAQVRPPQALNAALAGVYAHGLAGDCAAGEKTQLALVAYDIIDAMPQAFKKLTGRS